MKRTIWSGREGNGTWYMVIVLIQRARLPTNFPMHRCSSHFVLHCTTLPGHGDLFSVLLLFLLSNFTEIPVSLLHIDSQERYMQGVEL